MVGDDVGGILGGDGGGDKGTEVLLGCWCS